MIRKNHNITNTIVVSLFSYRKKNVTVNASKSDRSSEILKRPKIHVSNKIASERKKPTAKLDQISKATKRSSSNIEAGIMTRSKKAKMATNACVSPAVEIPAIQKPKSISSNTINKSEQAKTVQSASQSNAVANMKFVPGEVVWCKIRGWSHWPGIIKTIENNKFNVLWFNDYRTSKVFHTQLFKFHLNFNEFTKKFGRVVGLETAAKEAVLYSMSKISNK